MPSNDRTAWEYRTLRPPRQETKKEVSDPVDELGAEGWELADTLDYVGGGTKYIVLKRPADNESESGDE